MAPPIRRPHHSCAHKNIPKLCRILGILSSHGDNHPSNTTSRNDECSLCDGPNLRLRSHDKNIPKLHQIVDMLHHIIDVSVAESESERVLLILLICRYPISWTSPCRKRLSVCSSDKYTLLARELNTYQRSRPGKKRRQVVKNRWCWKSFKNSVWAGLHNAEEPFSLPDELLLMILDYLRPYDGKAMAPRESDPRPCQNLPRLASPPLN